ncbi:MAG: hypothetical protein F6K17_27685 [Okeania sp. SIO3C4]|nr:hypothetical protein [Okeania sp. SIO3B3]NER06100.1 hypothetical protein [Okeania sp. SIO3C4]
MGKLKIIKDESLLTGTLKKDIKWTPKKLTFAGICLLAPYTAILVYVISSGAPLGLIILMLLVPVVFFGGFSLLYYLTKNL